MTSLTANLKFISNSTLRKLPYQALSFERRQVAEACEIDFEEPDGQKGCSELPHTEEEAQTDHIGARPEKQKLVGNSKFLNASKERIKSTKVNSHKGIEIKPSF